MSYHTYFFTSISETLYLLFPVVSYVNIKQLMKSQILWLAFALSNSENVGSNPTGGMNVCVPLFCVRVVMCVGSCLATGWSPVQGNLPTAYRFRKMKERPGPNKRAVEPNIKVWYLVTKAILLNSLVFLQHQIWDAGSASAAETGTWNTEIMLYEPRKPTR
jgi:hypothetical protein